MTQKQSKLQQGRVAMRLAKDGPLVRVIDLVPTLKKLLDRPSLSAKCVERWIRRGRSGRRLDGMHVEGEGWCSTHQAVLRFAAEVRCVEESQPSAKG